MLPGDRDLDLFAAGEHRRASDVLGAVPVEGGGTRFAVWAPDARAVAVLGDWNGWRGEALAPCGASGVWAFEAPDARGGDHYQFAIAGADGRTSAHPDPLARVAEVPPARGSIVAGPSGHAWTDEGWMLARRCGDGAPLRIGAVDLECRRADLRTFAAVAEWLAEGVPALGFTHVELSAAVWSGGATEGVAGCPTAGWWVPDPRSGTPDEFRALVDRLHGVDVGVILRWPPSGSVLDGPSAPPGQARSLLISNARFWLDEFHVDGLRVVIGSAPELGAPGADDGVDVALLRGLTTAIAEEHPTALVVAGEGATWARVTHPVAGGGLGFTHKWNVGWVHDTLGHFRTPPEERAGRGDDLTFGLVYASSERTVLPLAPELLVDRDGARVGPLPGDDPERLADVRALLAWAWAMPGAPLVPIDGGSQRAVDLEDAGVRRLVAGLNAAAAEWPAVWERDRERAGFEWIDTGDGEHAVLAFVRWAHRGAHAVACVANLGPSPMPEHRIGLPWAGDWEVVIDTDATEHGGGGRRTRIAADPDADGRVHATDSPLAHGRPASLSIDLPPLTVLWLAAHRPTPA